MIGPVFQRELGDYLRNTQFRALCVVLIVLCGLASFDGWRRAKEADDVRSHAERQDRKNWVEQGANNPHGAAHFSRYAFRPTPGLAALEPGIWDFAGSAIWMEAHHQNPATLRRSEDALGRAPLPALSVGWITRSLGSLALLVLLFPSIAKERERKTLRALTVAGMSSRSFVLGKIGAACAVTMTLTVAACIVALLPGMMLGMEWSFIRVLTILATTFLALIAFAMSIIVVSAKSSSSGAAMIVGGALWILWAIGVPTLGAKLSTTVYPDFDEQVFRSTTNKEAQSDFWTGGAKKESIEKLEREILQQRGAKSLEDIHFNKKGVMLQAHERYANAVFDRRYGELNARHRSQDRVISLAALASPLLALQRVTAGIAGTDLRSQQRFATEAEMHRRRIIAQLNQDLMENGGDKGMKYEANRDLWETIPDFTATSFRLREVLRHYWFELAILLGWTLLSSLLAFWAANHVMRNEELCS